MTTRRQFVTGAVVAGVTVGSARWIFADDKKDETAKLDLAMVGKFVGKSHGDIETVKSMLKEEPALVNAAWDWAGGDWETGLNAASHVGRPEIAELLLENGARLDAPAAVMLGLKPVVAEMLKVYPKLPACPGAHEIPLLSHAIFGREKADDVFELLLAAGADVNAKSKMSMTPLMAAASVGRISQVDILLGKGADPFVKDSKGRTALDVAVNRKKHECVKAIKNAMGAK